MLRTFRPELTQAHLQSLTQLGWELTPMDMPNSDGYLLEDMQ